VADARRPLPATTPAPWLAAPAPRGSPPSHSTTGPAALAAEPRAFDLDHLSNVLDWLTPDAAAATLATAAEGLRPGGWVFIRQLNSTLDVRRLGPAFDWRTDESADLLARDRSFFYRSLHLGRKR
jgi:S-adenosylmethionine-diacylglycerol 3-amino-3-carboxypropyl transferase